MTTVCEKWQMVQFARKHGCKATNKDGKLVKEHASPYGNELKVYTSSPYYYMSSTDSEELLFDGVNYEERHSNKAFEVE